MTVITLVMLLETLLDVERKRGKSIRSVFKLQHGDKKVGKTIDKIKIFAI